MMTLQAVATVLSLTVATATAAAYLADRGTATARIAALEARLAALEATAADDPGGRRDAAQTKPAVRPAAPLPAAGHGTSTRAVSGRCIDVGTAPAMPAVLMEAGALLCRGGAPRHRLARIERLAPGDCRITLAALPDGPRTDLATGQDPVALPGEDGLHVTLSGCSPPPGAAGRPRAELGLLALRAAE